LENSTSLTFLTFSPPARRFRFSPCLPVSNGQSAFQATPYYRQLSCITKFEVHALRRAYKGIKKHPSIKWRVHDVLKAFTDFYCYRVCNLGVFGRLTFSVESMDGLFFGLFLLPKRCALPVWRLRPFQFLFS
jgi:hypothetical protein